VFDNEGGVGFDLLICSFLFWILVASNNIFHRAVLDGPSLSFFFGEVLINSFLSSTLFWRRTCWRLTAPV
jgi:hypothetical protein